MYLIHWLMSRQVRRGAEMLSVVRKHYDHQRDQLAPNARAALEAGLAEFTTALRTGPKGKPLDEAMARFEDVAGKWLLPYPHHRTRENFESLLGTAVLVFAFKTFFATPMEIPTGSAQPTYWGVTYEDLRDHPEVKIPTGPAAWLDYMLHGTSYYEVIAEADGPLQDIRQERTIKMGNGGISYTYVIRAGDRTYEVKWAPERDTQLGLLDEHTRQPVKAYFKKGEPIVRCAVHKGDRIFVERVVYNFRRPQRGEYFVFQSTGVGPQYGVVQGTHYIKRLVAEGGERVRIGDDRRLYINGQQLPVSTPGFEKVLGFDPARAPVADVYSGYVNDRVWRRYGWRPPGATECPYSIAEFFPDDKTEYTVPKNHYLGFGDNTMNSSDGRHWGSVPREKVIGKSLLVMWPFSRHRLVAPGAGG